MSEAATSPAEAGSTPPDVGTPAIAGTHNNNNNNNTTTDPTRKEDSPPTDAPQDNEQQEEEEEKERRLRERLKAKAAEQRQASSSRAEEEEEGPSRTNEQEEKGSEGHRGEQQQQQYSSDKHPRDRRHRHHSRRDERYDHRRQGRHDRHESGGAGSGSDRGVTTTHGDHYDRRLQPEQDDFGRRRRRPASPPARREGHRSSRSRSPPRGHRRHHRGRHDRHRRRRGHYHARSRSRSRSPPSHSYSSSSSSSSDDDDDSSVSSSSSDGSAAAAAAQDAQARLYSKDQRTVFVQQLVQRTTERELKKFFAKERGLKVNDVILLRDKRTGRHKGCAYVELRHMTDVPQAVALSNQVPTFQRFPILVKASEAEKNYLAAAAGSSTGTTATAAGGAASTSPTHGGAALPSAPPPPTHRNVFPKPPPLVGPNGKLQEAQKVYVGSLDPSVTQEHLFLLYSQFGYLDKVAVQTDTATGISKGFGFLSFGDPKDACLALQTMSGQVLAGRPMKTGWAVNQIPTVPGAQVVTAESFPADAAQRTTRAYYVLGQLNMGVSLDQIRQSVGPSSSSASQVPGGGGGTVPSAPASSSSRVPTVADARASLAAQVGAAVVVPPAAAAPPPPTTTLATVGRADQPTPHILVHNMFDKEEETEPGWEGEIQEEFEEECAQYGEIRRVQVRSTEPGGKIYASFATVDGAQKCASSIAGRWFNKRQLRVEFVSPEEIPA